MDQRNGAAEAKNVSASPSERLYIEADDYLTRLHAVEEAKDNYNEDVTPELSELERFFVDVYDQHALAEQEKELARAERQKKKQTSRQQPAEPAEQTLEAARRMVHMALSQLNNIHTLTQQLLSRQEAFPFHIEQQSKHNRVRGLLPEQRHNYAVLLMRKRTGLKATADILSSNAERLAQGLSHTNTYVEQLKKLRMHWRVVSSPLLKDVAAGQAHTTQAQAHMHALMVMAREHIKASLLKSEQTEEDIQSSLPIWTPLEVAAGDSYGDAKSTLSVFRRRNGKILLLPSPTFGKEEREQRLPGASDGPLKPAHTRRWWNKTWQDVDWHTIAQSSTTSVATSVNDMDVDPPTEAKDVISATHDDGHKPEEALAWTQLSSSYSRAYSRVMQSALSLAKVSSGASGDAEEERSVSKGTLRATLGRAVEVELRSQGVVAGAAGFARVNLNFPHGQNGGVRCAVTSMDGTDDGVMQTRDMSRVADVLLLSQPEPLEAAVYWSLHAQVHADVMRMLMHLCRVYARVSVRSITSPLREAGEGQCSARIDVHYGHDFVAQICLSGVRVSLLGLRPLVLGDIVPSDSNTGLSSQGIRAVAAARPVTGLLDLQAVLRQHIDRLAGAAS